MTQGFYSLIQYCPDFSRAETANVGLMLIQPEQGATAVRVVDKVGPAMRRLGRKGDAATLLGSVQSMAYRIEHEQFRSLEALEKFARTRGNQMQLTMPRSIRIDAIERDVDRLFAELVDAARPPERANQEAAPALLRAFTEFAARLPERVFIGREFHVRDLGIPIRSDYAYWNGKLNIVLEMPSARDLDAVRINAMGMSKEGELVRNLEEGEGSLVVVSSVAATTKKAARHEQEFGEILGKLDNATFVTSAEIPEFTKRVGEELAGH